MQKHGGQNAVITIHGPAEDQRGEKHGKGPQGWLVEQMHRREDRGCDDIGQAEPRQEYNPPHQAVDFSLQQKAEDHLLCQGGEGKETEGECQPRFWQQPGAEAKDQGGVEARAGGGPEAE